MEEANKQHEANNPSMSFNLEKSLAPLWKSTYYLGFAFDWCRPILNQGKPSITIRSLIISFALVILFYSTSSLAFQLNRSISRTDIILIFKIVTMIALWQKFVILFTCFYFAIYRAEIRAFFFHWGLMEEQNTLKGVDAGKLKRTCILVSALYYTYNIFFWFYISYGNAFRNDNAGDDY